MGFTCLDHLHPGSNLARPIVPPPIFTSSIFPFSNLRTSSGELRCLTSILDEGIDPPLRLHAIRLGGPRDLRRSLKRTVALCENEELKKRGFSGRCYSLRMIPL